MAQAYPMMVDLVGQSVLVVGGGTVAERKVLTLLPTEAKITVVSPTATQQLQIAAKQGRLELLSREYRSSDGENSMIVIAATNQPLVNLRVYEDAMKRQQWINVVDQPSLCNFTVPSVVRRGKLMIAIATDGTSPSLAKKIRQELEQKYGMEYELLLEISQELRLRLQWEVDDPKLRYQLMKELVADHWVQVCRERPTTARAEMLAWLEEQIQVRGGKICERS